MNNEKFIKTYGDIFDAKNQPTKKSNNNKSFNIDDELDDNQSNISEKTWDNKKNYNLKKAETDLIVHSELDKLTNHCLKD